MYVTENVYTPKYLCTTCFSKVRIQIALSKICSEIQSISTTLKYSGLIYVQGKILPQQLF